MLSIFQIDVVIDSIIVENKKVLDNFVKSLKLDHKYLLPNNVENLNELQPDSIQNELDLSFQSLSKEEKNVIYDRTIGMLTRDLDAIKGQRDFIKSFCLLYNLYTYSLLLGCDYLEHRYFYLSSGIGYIQKGGTDNIIQLDENTHPVNTIPIKGKWDYLHLNTSLRIRYPFEKSHLYLGAGLKADVLTSSTDNNKSYLSEGYKMASIIPGMKIEMGINREVKRLVIGVNASYLIDFKDAGKSILPIDGAHNKLRASNTLLLFTLGYRL